MLAGSYDDSLDTRSSELIVLSSWLNTLYLSMDANFKLKQKERGFNDPPLSNGLAYMVLNERLREHLAHCADKGLTTEVSKRPQFTMVPDLNFQLDQYLWLNFQCGQPSVYKVCEGVRCYWCCCG